MPNESRQWRCNNCGHGATNRPDRVCNCRCHEPWDAAIEAAVQTIATFDNNGDVISRKSQIEAIRALKGTHA